jgi:hypothetical protein
VNANAAQLCLRLNVNPEPPYVLNRLTFDIAGEEPLASAPKPPREPVQDKAVPRAAVDAVQKTLRESGEKAEGDVTFLRARTANEVIKAQERSVRLAKIKGELVDRARAVTTVFGLARRERDAWVQWPARVAALMAADLQIDPHQMETVLEKHVRRHLAELSDVRVELR